MDNKEDLNSKWVVEIPTPEPIKITKTFSLQESEEKNANAFITKHRQCSKKHPTTIGGAISYIFTPTSIGDVIYIKCNICGEIEEITDVSNW